MTRTEFAMGSATFLVVAVAGFLSTAYVDRQFAAEHRTSPSACVDAGGICKNWLWPNVPALSPKCREDS